jgi:hypothetical protein
VTNTQYDDGGRSREEAKQTIVYVLAADNRGQYVIPFPVVFRDDSWWNARTGEELDAFVAGWRPAGNAE